MIFDASQDPLALWLYAERHLSLGVRSYSPFSGFSEMDTDYRPDSAVRNFAVPCVWVEASQDAKFIFESHRLARDLAEFYSPEPGRFLLPIHPATIPLLPFSVRALIEESATGPNLEVSPTSSTRTVYVHGSNGSDKCPRHFLKLHFPGRISRFVRTMTRKDVVHQLRVSEQIQRALLPHLPDLGGGYALSHGNSSVGFLLRSTRPECGLKDAFFTLPGFSLYGGDRLAPDDPPLLAQLPCHFRESPADFIINRIIVPMIELWVRTVSDLGIIPELHGQNALFCFDCRGSVSSVCFRDSDLFTGVRIRRICDPECSEPRIDAMNDCALVGSDRILSLPYDGFLAHHFLEAIAAFAERLFGIQACILRDAAKSAFRTAGGDTLPLSKNIFYYDNHLHPGRQFVLTEHPSFELWR